MSSLAFKRTLHGLVPADDHATRKLARVPLDAVVRCTFEAKRNNKNLRRWWALCNLIYSTSPDFKSPEQVHDFLKIKAGHCTHIVSKSTGEVYLVADSIAFSRLNEEQFQAVWRRAVQAVCEDILPTVTEAALEEEILRLVGAVG